MDEVVDRKSGSVASSNREPRRRGRALPIGLTLLILGVGLGWWLLSAPKNQPPPRHPADAVNVVRTGDVTAGDMEVAVDALGTVTPLSTVVVKTQISGKLIDVGFKEGQSVKKGDFLAQIDPQPYQAALDQARGQLARDEALLATAKLDLARYEKLMSQDSIARQQVDTQRSLVQQNEATVRTDKANVDTASINLNYCRIVALSDGRTGLRLVDPGNYVQPTDPNGIVVITQMQPISVIFTVAQDTIPQFIKEFRAGTRLPVRAYNRNSTEQLAEGTLTTIDNQIDPTTGTVRLRATFPNEDEALFPNQFVNIKLIVKELKGVTIAPLAAVQIGAPGPYVYVTNPDQTVSVRPVKLGPSEGERTAILSGLEPGEKVVVDGMDRLREGAKIRVAVADHHVPTEKAAAEKPAAEKTEPRQGAPEENATAPAEKAGPDKAGSDSGAAAGPPTRAGKGKASGEQKLRPGAKK